VEALLVRIEAKDEQARHDEREAKTRRREARKAGTKGPGAETDGKEPT
jgi:hypothetical protein